MEGSAHGAFGGSSLIIWLAADGRLDDIRNLGWAGAVVSDCLSSKCLVVHTKVRSEFSRENVYCLDGTERNCGGGHYVLNRCHDDKHGH